MGWVVGFAVGGVVVLVVVILLVGMIVLAGRIAGRAEAILAALHDSADATRGLWALPATSATAERILVAARRARESLADGEAVR